MRVLLACEESQAVCTEFRERGHEAFSCDLLDCSGNHPEWHIKGDVLEIIKEKWDFLDIYHLSLKVFLTSLTVSVGV